MPESLPAPALAEPRLEALASAIAARPAVERVLDGFVDENGLFSVTFAIDVAHPEAWEEVRRFGWLFNNLYGAVADDVTFRPVVFEQNEGRPLRHLCWMLEGLSPAYSPDRALDVLLTPLAPFEPPLVVAV